MSKIQTTATLDLEPQLHGPLSLSYYLFHGLISRGLHGNRSTGDRAQLPNKPVLERLLDIMRW